MNHFSHSLSGFLSGCLFFLFTIMLPQSGKSASLNDTSWNMTIQRYSGIPCLTPEELEYGMEVIKGLDYNSLRVFRKLCLLPGISFENSKRAWIELLSHKMSFEQVQIFETWSSLPQADLETVFKALPEIRSLDYEAGKSFKQYCLLPKISAGNALNVIPLLNRLDDAGNRAASALFSIPSIEPASALEGLSGLLRLDSDQSLAAESFARIQDMSAETMLDGLILIKQFHQENAWNASALFKTPNMTGNDGWNWLISYFATTPEIQEQLYYQLPTDRKKILTNGFYRAGTDIIWKINDLHSITDQFGIEISKYDLQRYSQKQLLAQFERLSPRARAPFERQFYSESARGNRAAMTQTLRQATAAARVTTGKHLVSANIYALLSQGSELYDSSFRNILVPILLQRIADNHRNNLLVFLNNTDPANSLVSDFIVSLAQKGKLTDFFPKNAAEQREILKLVVQSAFRDENSIILFSATFTQLIQLLEPTTRTFLIEQMIVKSQTENKIFSRLIRVILQYYLEEFPQLLSAIDRQNITDLLRHHQRVDFSLYLQTPFPEWKSDGRLDSVSIFHPDDDGAESFLSFAHMLLKNNYTPVFSDRFTVTYQSDEEKRYFQSLIRAAGSAPSQNLSKLFHSLARNSYSVSFNKVINNITISHSVFIYGDEKIQSKLFEQFIRSKTEMFAQRGHSYWRTEQLIEPMEKLIESGAITRADLTGKQRFLSLGSCGGVKAYTKLHDLFIGHVDLLATIGTGISFINDPYNQNLFEVIARSPSSITWKDVERLSASIFDKGHGKDYLQPGSLPAILHKIINENKEASPETPHTVGTSLSGVH